MPEHVAPGRRIEILFAQEDRQIEVECGDDDATQFVETLVEAITSDTADDAERLLRAGLGPGGSVERRY